MIPALSLLIVSLLVMVSMIYFKMVEIRTGRSFWFFGHDRSEALLKSKIHSTRTFLYRWNWKTINLFYHFLLEKVENFILAIFRYVMRKFSKPVKMVKGEGNIREEKPDSSFFLKNIEEHKNNLKERE